MKNRETVVPFVAYQTPRDTHALLVPDSWVINRLMHAAQKHPDADFGSVIPAFVNKIEKVQPSGEEKHERRIRKNGHVPFDFSSVQQDKPLENQATRFHFDADFPVGFVIEDLLQTAKEMGVPKDELAVLHSRSNRLPGRLNTFYTEGSKGGRVIANPNKGKEGSDCVHRLSDDQIKQYFTVEKDGQSVTITPTNEKIGEVPAHILLQTYERIMIFRQTGFRYILRQEAGEYTPKRKQQVHILTTPTRMVTWKQ